MVIHVILSCNFVK